MLLSNKQKMAPCAAECFCSRGASAQPSLQGADTAWYRSNNSIYGGNYFLYLINVFTVYQYKTCCLLYIYGTVCVLLHIVISL